MQKPIISEAMWERVQELRSNKRRNTKTGRKSLFSGLIFCSDCKAKLHFCAAKSLKLNQEHFRCSNYKSGRGTCSVHYIRNVVLEQIVLEAVSDLADFVRCYESVFLYLVTEKTAAEHRSDLRHLKTKMEKEKRRIQEIDKAIERLFEANMEHKISDERFMKMTSDYEAEQKALEASVAEMAKELKTEENSKTDMRLLMKALHDFLEVRTLTPEIVNSLIQRIEVHNSKKVGSKKRVKIDIYFTAIGLFNLPTEQELSRIIKEYEEQNKSKAS